MSDLIDRQKAIDALQKEIDKGKPPFNDTIGAIRCGVRLARNIIEDLPSSQPIAKDINVPCTDTISRQAAIDVHCELCADSGSCSDICPDVEVFKLLPSVQERKGRWIYADDCDNRYDSYWCSNCHHGITVDAERRCDIGFVIEDLKYCPNCGAHMGGEQDDND